MLNIYFFFSLLHIFIFIILKMKNKRGAINLLNSMSNYTEGKWYDYIIYLTLNLVTDKLIHFCLSKF